jgi:hypothetical protein
MKKDIEIPKSEGVYIAIVLEYNKEFEFDDWNAYLINDLDTDLEMVFVVTEGYDTERRTSKMRHAMPVNPKKSYAKIELMMEDVFKLNNKFSLSYFAESKLYDKKFIFNKNTINKKALRDIPHMESKGVLMK